MGKSVVLLCLAAVSASSAFFLDEHHYKHESKKDYNFDYSVHDPHTHEQSHSHQQSSKDGVVKGYYSVKDADGSLREVHYTAGKDGFKAIVTKNGVQVHPHPSAEGSSNEHHFQEEHHGALELLKPLEPHLFPEYNHLPQHHEHHDLSEHHEQPFAEDHSSLYDIGHHHFDHYSSGGSFHHI